MMSTVPSPNERASIAASAVASGPGAFSSPAASSVRSAGSASDGGFELTGGGLGQSMADFCERGGHARVEIIDEAVDLLLRRRRKGSAYHDGDVAVCEGVYRFLDRSRVPESIAHDIVNRAVGSAEDQFESAAHERTNASVGRSMPFGVDNEGCFPLGEILGRLQQSSDLSLYGPVLLRHEGETAEFYQRGYPGNATAVSFPGGNDRLRSAGGVHRDRNVE